MYQLGNTILHIDHEIYYCIDMTECEQMYVCIISTDKELRQSSCCSGNNILDDLSILNWIVTKAKYVVLCIRKSNTCDKLYE